MGVLTLPRGLTTPGLEEFDMRILRYTTDNGTIPFSDWLSGIRDKIAQASIRMRLRQLEMGNFGDAKPVGHGVVELRVHVGAGYRVYCARHDEDVVILLCGGGKQTQTSDIRIAKSYWANWKRRQK
jgi:putative addiction module killer protein